MPESMTPAMVGWLAAWGIALLVVVVGLLVGRAKGNKDEPAPAGGPSKTPDAAPTPERELSPRDRFRLGLAKSRDGLAAKIRGAFGRDEDLEALLEGLEQGLIESDVGVRTTQTLLEAVRALPASDRTETGVRAAIREQVRGLLAEPAPFSGPGGDGPWVCLVVGVNGVGKTTTIGKLAARYRDDGRSVLLVAGDTFRAAAIDQLGVWADRVDAEIVRQEPGADPSSVVFDGVGAAVSRKADVVLIDTAGRLHTKVNLMEELKKVRRVVERQCPGAPHEVLLVLDATTGQNAISQARTFSEAVDVTGVALSKLDGSARGGMAVAIRSELGLPVRFVGLGETAADLQPFDLDDFLDGLLPEDD